MKNKSLTLFLLIIVVKTGWTQNANLDYKYALKIYNLTTYEEQLKSKRLNDTSSYRYQYTNTTLQILQPTIAFQWKTKKNNLHEIELTSLILGKIGAKTENDEGNDIVISPYEKLRNVILGQSDFVKKQNDIIRFVMEFTREALENTDETIHWRYCIKTGVKLIPSFRYTLASAFINDPTNYGRVVESLKQRIGKLGDDGEAWVDEHSGQVIQAIEFDHAPLLPES